MGWVALGEGGVVGCAGGGAEAAVVMEVVHGDKKMRCNGIKVSTWCARIVRFLELRVRRRRRRLSLKALVCAFCTTIGSPNKLAPAQAIGQLSPHQVLCSSMMRYSNRYIFHASFKNPDYVTL